METKMPGPGKQVTMAHVTVLPKTRMLASMAQVTVVPVTVVSVGRLRCQ